MHTQNSNTGLLEHIATLKPTGPRRLLLPQVIMVLYDHLVCACQIRQHVTKCGHVYALFPPPPPSCPPYRRHHHHQCYGNVKTDIDSCFSDGPTNFSTRSLLKILDSMFSLDTGGAFAPVHLRTSELHGF